MNIVKTEYAPVRPYWATQEEETPKAPPRKCARLTRGQSRQVRGIERRVQKLADTLGVTTAANLGPSVEEAPIRPYFVTNS